MRGFWQLTERYLSVLDGEAFGLIERVIVGSGIIGRCVAFSEFFGKRFARLTKNAKIARRTTRINVFLGIQQ